MEAAAEIAAGNPKGLLLYRDEMAGWWRSFNRYSGGDGERQFWLQAYGARTHTVDRKKAGKPVIVPRLSISALGGVQPDVLATMLNREADGFAARFLFAFPEPTAGFTLAPIVADIAGASAALRRLHGLALIEDGNSQQRPFVCHLDRRAAAFFETWWRARKRIANVAIGLWGHWLGKQGSVALVLEHLWWSTPANSADSANSYPQEICEAAIIAATELIDNWAGPMAQRAFGAAAARTDRVGDPAATGPPVLAGPAPSRCLSMNVRYGIVRSFDTPFDGLAATRPNRGHWFDRGSCLKADLPRPAKLTIHPCW